MKTAAKILAIYLAAAAVTQLVGVHGASGDQTLVTGTGTVGYAGPLYMGVNIPMLPDVGGSILAMPGFTGAGIDAALAVGIWFFLAK
jgi:hypothetical protein